MAGRILIVDDIATSRIVSKGRLTAACYPPLIAVDGQGCLDMVQKTRPDIVLLNVDLPDMPGMQVLRQLRADPRSCDIPVIMFDTRNDPATRLEALQAGAEDCLPRPVSEVVLMARLRKLMRARQILDELGGGETALPQLGLAEAASAFATRGHILLVSERPEVGLRLRNTLSHRLSHQLHVFNRAEALAEGILADQGGVPDLFVIDTEHMGLVEGGLRLMSELRSRTAARHAAMVLLLHGASSDDVALCYDMGADLVLDAVVSGPELAARLENLTRAKQIGDHRRLALRRQVRLANIDPLTGLYNRRHALPRLVEIALRAYETQTSFALIMIDLDRFKLVNDDYGHSAGDKVLVEIAHRLTENLRMSDLVARMGGEEFLVALPDITLAEARRTAERICQAIQARPVLIRNGVALTVTASLGVTLVHPDRGDWDSDHVLNVVDKADRAMLAAKAEGRNQVIVRASAA